MSVAERIRERKKLIIDMLTEAPGNRVLGADIRREISAGQGRNISKATLSSDMKALVNDGYEIISDTEGYRLLNPGYDPERSEKAAFEPATADILSRWLIMVILSESYDRYMSAQDILCRYREMTDAISLSKLKDHLDNLERLKYISRHTRQEAWEAGQTSLSGSGEGDNKLFYHICDSAPVISFIDREAVMDFNAYFHDGGYAGELESTLKIINDKIAAVCQDIYAEGSGAYRSNGKRNDIPKDMTDKLSEILGLPFRKYALEIKYREKEGVKDLVFKTAMIIFNVETNGFYLLGEVWHKSRWQRKNLKLGEVTDMSANASIRNDIYESRKYREVFNKMWSSAPDEPTEVEVIFEETPEMLEEIEALRKARNDTANVTFTHDSDGTGLIRYRDRIMGTHDFLRFVRSLGDAAVIIKPEKSRKHLIAKTKEMLEGYRQILRSGEEH